MNVSAVIKRKNKWLVGFITSDMKFKKKSEIKKLAEIKKQSNYMTLQRYLQIKSKGEMQKDIVEKMLSKLKAESCYVLDKPFDLSEEEWELWWWNSYHPMCISCKYTCKQSHRVKIHNCRLLSEKK